MAAVIPPGTVAWGLQLPVQAQSTLFAEPWEADAGPDELVGVARAADAAGAFYVAVCDHTAIPRSHAEAMGTTWYDTMTTLGFLAAATSRTRLLSHVFVLPYVHPLRAAKALATLDRLSGGRAIAGVGAGHLQPEFELLGADHEQRGALLEEAIDVLAAALTDEFPEAGGPTWPVADFGVAPRPVQQPRPPIWVGGSTKAALRRAATKADGWLPQGVRKPDLPAAVATLREHRQRAGGDDAFDVGVLTEALYVGEPTWDVGRRCVSGKPDELAAVLQQWVDGGANQLQVRFRSRAADELGDQVAAFGAEVAPLLDGAPAAAH